MIVIGVPVYNDSHLLEKSLPTIAQAVDHVRSIAGYEIIIVVHDDGSVKAESERIRGIVESVSSKYRVKIVYTYTRRDRSTDPAQNIGRLYRSIQKLYGLELIKYLINIDSDTMVSRGYFEKLIPILEKDERIGIAGGIVVNEHYNWTRHIRGTGMVIRSLVLSRCDEAFNLPGVDMFLQLCAVGAGMKLAINPHATMILLRKTKTDYYRLGFIDGVSRLNPVYAIGRSILHSIRRNKRAIVITYMRGYMYGRRFDVSDEEFHRLVVYGRHIILKSRFGLAESPYLLVSM